jgi:ribulose-phosphate 3-epimerase
MDNKFVPNLTGSVEETNSLAQETRRLLWVHLMVEEPIEYIQKLALPAGSLVSFHIENGPYYKDTIEVIHSHGWLASIAINPSTPLEAIFDAIPLVDHILIMSVKPGFSGQTFIPDTLERLDTLNIHMAQQKLSKPIGIDGGITMEHFAPLVARKVTDFVLGSALFDQTEPIEACKKNKQYLDAL